MWKKIKSSQATESDQFLKRWKAIKSNLIRKTTLTIQRSTIQFFDDSHKNHPEGIGSGILFRIRDDRFLITAAHVHNADLSRYIVLPNGDTLRPGGELHATTFPYEADDEEDIAAMQLDALSAQYIEEYYDFLTIQDLAIDHEPDGTFTYLAYGYPSSRTRFNSVTSKITPKPFVFITEAIIDFDYESCGWDKDLHYAMSFSGRTQNEIDDGTSLSPHPHGNSGGGLWLLNNYASIPMIKNRKLIGILTEFRKEPKGAFLATRFSFVMDFICEHFNVDLT